MIKSLFIKNFQSHKLSKLKFHPGLNIIIGSSDVGKTAIIRAMRWLIYNRPISTSFKSKWGGLTKVVLRTDDNRIVRSRGRANTYHLNDQRFKALRSEVPEEISKTLNIKEINLQYQLDSPFLLDSSAGEVATHFNEIAKIDVIDSTMQNIHSWLHKIENDITNHEQRINELEKDMEQFEGLDYADGLLVGLEAKARQVRSIINDKQELNNLIADLTLLYSDKKLYANLPEIEFNFDRVNRLHNKKKRIQYNKYELEDLVADLKHDKQELANQRKLIRHYIKELKENFPNICPLCGQEVKGGKHKS